MMDKLEFEEILNKISCILTEYLVKLEVKPGSKKFENKVREVLLSVSKDLQLSVDMLPPAQEFPDIVYGKFGIEVKYSDKDTWRSIANSIFEGRRNESAEEVYLLFGKAGGVPEVRWNKYEECIMHVRTSHVPRFEVEIDTEKPLFKKLGIEYDEFRSLPPEGKMPHIRKYARERLKPGERLWWIEDGEDEHSLPLEVKLYTRLTTEDKRRFRAEAAVLCPQVVKGSRARGKYDDATMYLLTYHGVLCNQARDLFTAGSVAMRGDSTRGGNYMCRALNDIEKEIKDAIKYLDERLFREYWGFSVENAQRIEHWLNMLDQHAQGWVPSEELFAKH